MSDFTHLAKIYGFECYYNDNTGDIEGTSWINQKLIELFVWIDVTFTNNEAFKIEIIQKL
ncbi:hypothetical protein MUY27_06675 [Mucilaginibacter sp. RS28]|uniref:Uncharacterized protein n=1 Tax=Mucilaginibacter straminoryzae TaxID=2932774 RepID=A0A9X2BB21_9SPHI|nr:hypothetical protein [Mucilaginibacter straminoryzae]MCJ8209387.1 hypothetical protein [Mucilaginibacter straminoryzae]